MTDKPFLIRKQPKIGPLKCIICQKIVAAKNLSKHMAEHYR